MNISTDFTHISPDFNKPSGGYEWWYFDGLSKDGNYGFAIIFYHNNPFSPRYITEMDKETAPGNRPAISISIYRKTKPVYYSFLEFDGDDFSWDEKSKILTIGRDSVTYKLLGESVKFEIKLDQKLASGHSVQGSISGSATLPPSKLLDSNSDENHSWNLLIPSADIEAELDIIGKHGEEEVYFTGIGYHDHNKGSEPMKDSFGNWYWGRYHFGEFTLVYYLMNKHGKQQFEAWLIDAENQVILESFGEVKLDYFNPNLYGVKSARKIELKSDQSTVNIQCIFKVDDGPFYQRFLGDSVINYKGQVHGCHGISEYIYPKNIHNQLYWPLIHMRLRYTDMKPHWVQKSRLMYPWTW